jgi:hypothetical protein
VQRGQISRAWLLQNEISAERICLFDDAFDDIIPARRIDDGVVDGCNKISFARHGLLPARRRHVINSQTGAREQNKAPPRTGLDSK